MTYQAINNTPNRTDRQVALDVITFRAEFPFNELSINKLYDLHAEAMSREMVWPLSGETIEDWEEKAGWAE